MNYKPNHSILIAYLYGELDQEEKEKVEAYINSSPEASKELEELKDVRDLLSERIISSNRLMPKILKDLSFPLMR